MVQKLLRALALAFSLALLVSAHAHSTEVSSVRIGHPYARTMLPGAKVGAGYLKITNNGPADRLLSAATDRAVTVQLHEMKTDGGVMVMRELKDGIVVPANGTVELKPGGYHVMFLNVNQPFKEGEKIKARLIFEKAGTIEIDFEVGSAVEGAPKMKRGEHVGAEDGK